MMMMMTMMLTKMIMMTMKMKTMIIRSKLWYWVLAGLHKSCWGSCRSDWSGSFEPRAIRPVHHSHPGAWTQLAGQLKVSKPQINSLALPPLPGALPGQEAAPHVPLPAAAGVRTLHRQQVQMHRWLQEHGLLGTEGTEHTACLSTTCKPPVNYSTSWLVVLFVC